MYTDIKHLHRNAQFAIDLTRIGGLDYSWQVYTDKLEPVRQFSDFGSASYYSICLLGWFILGTPKSHFTDGGIRPLKLYQRTVRGYIEVHDFESLTQFTPLFQIHSPRVMPVNAIINEVYHFLGMDVKLEDTAVIKVGDTYQPIGKIGAVKDRGVKDTVPDIFILPQVFFDLIEPVFHQLSPVIDDFKLNEVTYSRVIYIDLYGKWVIYLIEREEEAPGRVTSDLWMNDEVEFLVQKMGTDVHCISSPCTSADRIDSRQSTVWNDLIAEKLDQCYVVKPSVRLIPQEAD